MSCSIRVTTVRNIRLLSPAKQEINNAMVGAIQRITGFNPDTQMEVWWLEVLNMRDCFNPIPFNVDVIFNKENLDLELNLDALAQEVKVAVFEAIVATKRLLPLKIERPGVFCWIPTASGFYMGPKPQQDPSA